MNHREHRVSVFVGAVREVAKNLLRATRAKNFVPKILGAEKSSRWSLWFIPFLLLLVTACAEYDKNPAVASRDVLRRATSAVDDFRTHSEMREVFPQLQNAVGVVVLPRLIKAGFIGGGEGGTGVMVARRADGTWGYPAFYTLGSASIGLQLGIQDTAVMMVIRNRGALTALVEQQAKFGGDVGFTLVVAGKGVEGATTTAAGQDVIAYALPILGLYGGFTLEGGVLARRLDLNEGFYGQAATPQDILFNERVRNPEADALRNALAGQPR